MAFDFIQKHGHSTFPVTDNGKVGGKHFSYSKAGKKAAKDYAKRTGKSMTLGKKGSKRKSPLKAKAAPPLYSEIDIYLK